MRRALLLLIGAACGSTEQPLRHEAIARLSGTAAAAAPAAAPITTAPVAAVPITAGPASPRHVTPPKPRRLTGANLARLPAKVPGVPRVLFLGDSIAAGFGVPKGAAWPDLLAARLAGEDLGIEVLNGGAAGATSHFGAVLPDLCSLHPDVVVIELGGNDYIMGLPLDGVLQNLRGMVQAALAMSARVLLVGVHLPAALATTQRGRDFEALHDAVAAEFSVPLVDDMFADALGVPRFMQPDGIHPTAEGQMVVAENVLPQLRAVVQQVLGAAAP